MSLSGKKITLQSSDGELFEVNEAVALQSQTILMEADNIITLPYVTSEILAKVIDYCKKHAETPKADDRAAADEFKSWDRDFVNVPKRTLFDLILAANDLKIKGLLDLASDKVANHIIHNLTEVEQIREYFCTD
ncbi:hypothetical protein PTKIN_Ptkin12aG0186000 [Pterospermum kingtungense]